MPTTPACPECVGLVGASPKKAPHSDLLPSGKDSENRMHFKCNTCGYRWYIGPLGWSSLWDLALLLADSELCRPAD
jgi:hypothetical protein